jgi:hypothetical protein
VVDVDGEGVVDALDDAGAGGEFVGPAVADAVVHPDAFGDVRVVTFDFEVEDVLVVPGVVDSDVEDAAPQVGVILLAPVGVVGTGGVAADEPVGFTGPDASLGIGLAGDRGLFTAATPAVAHSGLGGLGGGGVLDDVAGLAGGGVVVERGVAPGDAGTSAEGGGDGVHVEGQGPAGADPGDGGSAGAAPMVAVAVKPTVEEGFEELAGGVGDVRGEPLVAVAGGAGDELAEQEPPGLAVEDDVRGVVGSGLDAGDGAEGGLDEGDGVVDEALFVFPEGPDDLVR